MLRGHLSISRISQLLLTLFWPNFIWRFLEPSLPDANRPGDICPVKIDPSRIMINLCQMFPDYHNLQFSTHSNPQKSKAKCIHFSKQNLELANIRLNGNSFPWVKEITLLPRILIWRGVISFRDGILCERCEHAHRRNLADWSQVLVCNFKM